MTCFPLDGVPRLFDVRTPSNRGVAPRSTELNPVYCRGKFQDIILLAIGCGFRLGGLYLPVPSKAVSLAAPVQNVRHNPIVYSINAVNLGTSSGFIVNNEVCLHWIC